MEYKCVQFTYMPVSIPYPQIFLRLGYSREKTLLLPGEEAKIRDWIMEAAGIIKLKGAALRMPVQSRTPEQIYVRDTCLTSKNFSKFASEAEELLLMGVTGSKAVMEKIRELYEQDFAKAVVFDAAASEIVDAGLDWITVYFKRQLVREGKVISKNRFSAGYGDFALENQRFFYTLLNMRELGVELNPSFQLLPEKSVTAAAVIYKENQSC